MKYKTAIKVTATGLFLLFGTLANAEKIVLQDGSTINGEVVSLQSGIYKIKTDSLGVMALQQHQVKSISYDTAATWSLDSLDSMKQASQSAVQSFDLETLQNNPKIQKLMSNSTIRDIQRDVN